MRDTAVTRAAPRDGEGIVQRTNAGHRDDRRRRKAWCEENPPLHGLPVRVRSPGPQIIPRLCSSLMLSRG